MSGAGEVVLSGAGRSLPPVSTLAAIQAISPTRSAVVEQASPAPQRRSPCWPGLDTDHPTLATQPARERLLAAAWLAGYRSPAPAAPTPWT